MYKSVSCYYFSLSNLSKTEYCDSSCLLEKLFAYIILFYKEKLLVSMKKIQFL